MSKETFVFILGTLVFLTSFLGLPSEYKEWLLIVSGVLLMALGYRLRRNAFLKSLEHASGERRGDTFVESGTAFENNSPTQRDTHRVI